MIRYPCRVPLAVPYWDGDTYRSVLRSLFTCGHERDRLKSLLINKLDVADVILCGSGTLALESTLRACGIGSGADVIVPTFCCTAVVQPILKIGAVPVFADVGEGLNITAANVEAALTQKTRAVIVPHLFGNPAEIVAITELARTKNMHVIDDAAQALGATIEGRPAGSFGDAGILSFGAEKVCFGIGGGVAVAREGKFFDAIGLPPASTRSAMRNFASTFFRRRLRRWTAALDSAKPEPDTPPTPYRREAMSDLAAAVAISLVRNLDANIAARRERVRMYQKLLDGQGRLHLIPHRPGSACLAQVVHVTPKSRGDDPAIRVIDELRSAGYEVQGSYVPMHLLGFYKRWTRHPLPNAEKVWSDLVELPCEPGVRIEDVEHIAEIVKRAAA